MSGLIRALSGFRSMSSHPNSDPIHPPKTVNTDHPETLGGFHPFLGFETVAWTDGEATLQLQLKPQHMNFAGVIHGGVLASLLDIVSAMAGTYCPHPGRMRKAITLTLSTTFTGQCNGGTITAIAHRQASGRRIFNTYAEIFDANRNRLAMATGTFRLRTGSETELGEAVNEVEG